MKNTEEINKLRSEQAATTDRIESLEQENVAHESLIKHNRSVVKLEEKRIALLEAQIALLNALDTVEP